MALNRIQVATALTPIWLAVSAASPAPPGAHPIVLENDYVRVTEIFARPGQQIAADGPLPRVIVSASRSRLEVKASGSAPRTVDYRPGQIVWRDPAAPQAASLIAGNAHLFVIELKHGQTPARATTAALAPDHSTIVDPDQHHQVLENVHVRVIDGMAPTGARSEAHSHPPSVMVSLTKSRFRVTIEGKTRIFDFEPGMVRWSNHFRHRWQILSGEARVVMVEIKAAHGDPRFRRQVAAARN